MLTKYLCKNIIALVFLLLPIDLISQNISRNIFPSVIGPYVQMTGTDHSYIYWAELSHTIKKGNSLDSLNTIVPVYVHKQHYLMPPIKSFLAGKRKIAYKISGIGSGELKLAPKSRETSVKFAVFGDNKSWHTNYEGSDEKYRKLISLLIKKEPEFVVNTGDLVFEGRDYRDWVTFFNIGKPLMKNVPYFPVIGNHEESSKPLFDFFKFPDNRSYYSFNWGPIHFIVLNSSGMEARVERRQLPQTEWKEFLEQFNDTVELPFFRQQLSWLQSDLEQHKDFPFIFVSFHYPVFNTLNREFENEDIIQNDWLPLFKQHQVSAVFNGHNHHYHHALKDGIHYIITAGAGAGIYERSGSKVEHEVMYSEENHFVLASASPENCRFEILKLNNQLIESFTIQKRK